MLSKQDGRVLFWVQYSYAMEVVYAHECRVAEKALTLSRTPAPLKGRLSGESADDILGCFTDPIQLQRWEKASFRGIFSAPLSLGGRQFPIKTEAEKRRVRQDYYQRNRERYRVYGRNYYMQHRELLCAKSRNRYREKKQKTS